MKTLLRLSGYVHSKSIKTPEITYNKNKLKIVMSASPVPSKN